jgi:hypothetical protein
VVGADRVGNENVPTPGSHFPLRGTRIVRFFLGNHEEARVYYERVMEQYEPSMRERVVSTLLEDLGLWCTIYGSINESALGHPDRARRLCSSRAAAGSRKASTRRT